MDELEVAFDHLSDAMSDLRWAVRAPTAKERAWSARKASVAIMRAQDIADKILSNILNTQAAE